MQNTSVWMKSTLTSHANSVKRCWEIKQIESSYLTAEQKGSSLGDKPPVIMKAQTAQQQKQMQSNNKGEETNTVQKNISEDVREKYEKVTIHLHDPKQIKQSTEESSLPSACYCLTCQK